MKLFKPAIRFFGMVVPLSLLLAAAVAYFYLPRLVAEVRNPLAGRYNSALQSIQAPRFSDFGIARGRVFSVRVNDSIRLSAYAVKAAGEARGTIVALHGYRSNKNRFLPAAGYFSRHGWNFIAVDLRAHNASSGRYTGFSYFERRDTDAFLDSLEARGDIRRPLVLYGHSIGAATALFTAARRGDADALILESCFDDFARLIPNYLDFYLGEELPASDLITRDLFERLHIPLDSLRPVAVASQIHIPVLQVQGDADVKVKPAQARRLFVRLASPQKQWMWIRGGTHNRLWLPDTTAYFERLNAFLTRVFPKHPRPAAKPQ